MPATALNLDTLEREGEPPPPPFQFVLEGHVYVLSDPHDVAWQDLLDVMSNPVRLIQTLLPDKAEQTRFYKVKLASWKLNALLDTFMKHYGFDPLDQKLLG
jgi:hypothetical protein